MFKSWSETKKEALDQLKPDLGMRSWNDLSSDEKYKIWKFLEYFFFNRSFDALVFFPQQLIAIEKETLFCD